MSCAPKRLLYHTSSSRSLLQSQRIVHSIHHASTLPLRVPPSIRTTISSNLHCHVRQKSCLGAYSDTSYTSVRWASRSSAPSKTSLRRVAVEAERSRGSISDGDSRLGLSDAGKNAKIVTAMCGVEFYDIETATSIAQAQGYRIDPYKTGLYPQVLHIQARPEDFPEQEVERIIGDVFVFPSGIVVAWGIDEEKLRNFVTETLVPASQDELLERIETEHLEYEEDPQSDKSKMVGDVIRIGTKVEEAPISREAGKSTNAQSLDQRWLYQHEANLILAKIAFSSGMAKSVKLAVLEDTLEAYFQSTRTIPDMMASAARLPFTRRFILRKTGELLKARQQLNLTSELTDSLPDMFWDSRHELGLESYFEQVGRALDVNVRSRVLNQKMDYAQEIVSVLREQLSERHSLKLEWLIIVLIAIEVAFEVRKLVNQYFEDHADTDNDDD